jgi:hypothetical protein
MYCQGGGWILESVLIDFMMDSPSDCVLFGNYVNYNHQHK